MEATMVGVSLEGNNLKSDESEQPLEYAGVFGGHGCTMCFFAAFEGFTCLWLSLVIIIMIASKAPMLISFALFGCGFHCCAQCMLSMFDPGNVSATLESLESGMEDEGTVAILEELRRIPPSVRIVAEAYHRESRGSGKNRRTTTVVDHSEEANFPYAYWKDVSGRVVGLENHDVVAIEVVPQIEFANAATAASHNSLTERLLDICRRYRHSVRSRQIVSLQHPKYEVHGSRVFVTRSAGVDHASWMNRSTYNMCRFTWPFLGTLYRTLFFVRMGNFRYSITSSISASRQGGPGWIEV